MNRTIELIGHITENGELEAKLPAGLPSGEVRITIELPPEAERESSEAATSVQQNVQRNAPPPGTPGEVLLAHMDDFVFAPGAVDEMMKAIEEGCEQIDWDSWQ
ncbi:MAG: hypothetical protein IT324_17145 [Anaerolineae bacterium]|nr:hypothetical protein [Anaerolineae bacterium]